MCIFCKIVNGEIPSYKLYEDELCLAFLDISQATVGHTLVIPKKHYANIFELDDEISMHMLKVVNIVSKKLKNTLGIENVNLLNNSGALAGQTVDHFHIHIIPRYTNNDVNFSFQEHTPDFDALKILCDKINKE